MVQKQNLKDIGKIVIGLTGSFGSGKTTVASFFVKYGAMRVDVDLLAHEAMRKGSPVFDRIAKLFRTDDVIAGGVIDRKKVASVIFRDEARRRKLEALIHPYVFERVVKEVTETSKPVVVVEVPLLFETGFDQHCHQTVVVKSSKAATVARLRDKGFSRANIDARVQAQMPLEEKIARADMIIDNSGTLNQTEREVEALWRKILPVSKGAK